MSQFTAYQTQQITFTDTSSGGVPPLNRLWSFPGGSITSATGATAQVTYGSPGTYTVTLTVTDDNGLTNSLVRGDVLNILPGL
jgi:PKD repeat protein